MNKSRGILFSNFQIKMPYDIKTDTQSLIGRKLPSSKISFKRLNYVKLMSVIKRAHDQVEIYLGGHGEQCLIFVVKVTTHVYWFSI